MHINTLSILALGWFYTTKAQDLLNCNGAYYSPSQYTCYNSTTLCPVATGVPTFPCGAACYSKLMYSCDPSSQTLSLLPYTSAPFTVEALLPGQQPKELNTAGRVFFLGPSADTATYCPEPPLSDALCNSFPNTTVFASPGAMQVSVPGGQAVYIAPDGALSITQAHSASTPSGSLFGQITAYEDGGFFYDGGGWLACPVGNNYQVFAALPDRFFIATCLPVVLRTQSGAPAYGAWQYI